MEEKLKEYRTLRRRKQLVEEAKQKLENTKQKLVKFLVPKIFTDMDKEKKEDEVVLLEEEVPQETTSPIQLEEPVESEVSELESFEEEKQESWKYFIVKWTIYSVIWLTMYIFFLKVGFGAVFFVISMLVGICLNTRTRRKKQGEVSAYSVFNENCVSIDGTLKAEQLQREMLYGGIGGVRMF